MLHKERKSNNTTKKIGFATDILVFDSLKKKWNSKNERNDRIVYTHSARYDGLLASQSKTPQWCDKRQCIACENKTYVCFVKMPLISNDSNDSSGNNETNDNYIALFICGGCKKKFNIVEKTYHGNTETKNNNDNVNTKNKDKNEI